MVPRNATIFLVSLLALTLLSMLAVSAIRGSASVSSCGYKAGELHARGMATVSKRDFNKTSDLNNDGCIDENDIVILSHSYEGSGTTLYTFEDVVTLSKSFGTCAC